MFHSQLSFAPRSEFSDDRVFQGCSPRRDREADNRLKASRVPKANLAAFCQLTPRAMHSRSATETTLARPCTLRPGGCIPTLTSRPLHLSRRRPTSTGRVRAASIRYRTPRSDPHRPRSSCCDPPRHIVLQALRKPLAF
ncbi:hypothetical protein GGE24_005164 [Bradyrhizobium centrosematis]|nr:hypothetical protein [Bradyrhizobium centrosematis]MCS3775825.1 hypothetical protein [Bradyrhizobium centrosematis]